jgi:hypothetical protein
MPLEKLAQEHDVLLKRKNDLVFLFSESIHSQPMSAQQYVDVNTDRRAAFTKGLF